MSASNGPFPGTVEPSKTFNKPSDEMKSLYVSGKLERLDEQVVFRHLDDSRARVDLGAAPDLVLDIIGTGTLKAYPHALKDAAGNAVAPRLVRLLEWDAPTTYQVGTITPAAVSINATDKANLKIGLYR